MNQTLSKLRVPEAEFETATTILDELLSDDYEHDAEAEYRLQQMLAPMPVEVKILLPVFLTIGGLWIIWCLGYWLKWWRY